jgi:hypothetical protein
MSFLGWCLTQQARIEADLDARYQRWLRRRFVSDVESARDVLWQNFERADRLTIGIARGCAREPSGSMTNRFGVWRS